MAKKSSKSNIKKEIAKLDVEKDVDRMKKSIDKLIDSDMVENIITDNKIEFEYLNQKYRVSKPSFKQKTDANRKRMVKFTELLRDEQFLLEKDLRELYKKRGIDVDEMDKKFQSLEKEKKEYLNRLGKAIKDKKPDNELQIFEDEIKKIYENQQQLAMEKTILLDSTIETQVLVYTYSYLTYLLTEKYVDEKWIQSWNSYEDFINEEESLVNVAVFNASLVSKNEIQEA